MWPCRCKISRPSRSESHSSIFKLKTCRTRSVAGRPLVRVALVLLSCTVSNRPRPVPFDERALCLRSCAACPRSGWRRRRCCITAVKSGSLPNLVPFAFPQKAQYPRVMWENPKPYPYSVLPCLRAAAGPAVVPGGGGAAGGAPGVRRVLGCALGALGLSGLRVFLLLRRSHAALLSTCCWAPRGVWGAARAGQPCDA